MAGPVRRDGVAAFTDGIDRETGADAGTCGLPRSSVPVVAGCPIPPPGGAGGVFHLHGV